MPKPHRATSWTPLPPAAGKPALPRILAALGSGGWRTAIELAAELGVTCGTVRRSVAAWRRAGLVIESGAAGYRLGWELDPLDPAVMWASLPAGVRRRVGLIENRWQVDSTSSECARRELELPDRAFVFAEWQVAGRGRRGHRWLSPPASNVQVSCLKRFPAGYARLSGLSLAVGVAVAEALVDCGIARVGLKWPNDLVVDGAKLGGILVELGGDAARACHAIIGIGLNVRLPGAVRTTLGQEVVDLAGLCHGDPPPRQRIAVALVARLVAALDLFAASGFGAFADAWAARDALAGRPVRVASGGGAFEGVALGVDRSGTLRVRCADGVRSVDAAEVSVRAR